MNWFKTKRIEWINEMLTIYGFINREHLEKKFYISVPQASKDLRDFQKKFPKRVWYNVNTKRYERLN